MKIIKKSEVVIDEVDLELGTYYFEYENGNYNKMILEYYDGEGVSYFLETVENYHYTYGIRIRQDFAFCFEDLPYKFSAFIREVSGKKINKEKFELEKQQLKH